MNRTEFTEVLLPNGESVKLKNHKYFQERINELYSKVPYFENYRTCDCIDEFNNCFEMFWIDRYNKIEKVKTCLDCMATYLLYSEDSGIKNPVLY
jgi:hypothetical protein